MNNIQKVMLIQSAIKIMEAETPVFETRRAVGADAPREVWDAAANADFAAERKWKESLQNMYKSERLLLEQITIEQSIELAKELIEQQTE